MRAFLFVNHFRISGISGRRIEMTSPIGILLDKLDSIETELEAEFAKRRAELRLGLERGRVIFEKEMLRRNHEMRTSL
jgi:hypothetical protein